LGISDKITHGIIFSAILGLFLVNAIPPTESFADGTTPAELISAEVQGESSVKLIWTHDKNPKGGYDIIINGHDTNKKWRTKALMQTVTGLADDKEFCFKIQARYTDSRNYPNSNEICVTTNEGEDGEPHELHTCNGHVATIVGTEGRDFLRGTNGDDVIVALGGNDKIWAKGGNDVICAGSGIDLILGGSGNDWIDAGPNFDLIFAGKGDDDIFARHGDKDLIHGGQGENFCQVDEKEKKIIKCNVVDKPYVITGP